MKTISSLLLISSILTALSSCNKYPMDMETLYGKEVSEELLGESGSIFLKNYDESKVAEGDGPSEAMILNDPESIRGISCKNPDGTDYIVDNSSIDFNNNSLIVGYVYTSMGNTRVTKQYVTVIGNKVTLHLDVTEMDALGTCDYAPRYFIGIYPKLPDCKPSLKVSFK